MLYLFGPPGAGKSTTMRALTEGCDRVHRSQPLHHEQLVHPLEGTPLAVELGRSRPGFPGTDTLPLNVAPTAARWVATRPAPLLLAEGDRLAHEGFLEAAEQAGYRVCLAYLHAPLGELDIRCVVRGSTQNNAWRRGRVTKAARLVDRAAARGWATVNIDTTGRTPAGVAVRLRDTYPFLNALPEARP